jgi:hypothetical protein
MRVSLRYRVFVASWLETQLWVDWRLFVAGIGQLVIGIALAVRRHAERSHANGLPPRD